MNLKRLRFDGRVAVVTGAGAGLGREYALLLANRGAKLVVNDLGGTATGEGASRRAADLVVEEIKANGGTAIPDYNSVIHGSKVIKTALDHFGRVDIVINNAGILRDRSILNLSEEDWSLVHDVHLKGSFKVTQAAWPYMKKQNYGRIIMTSSNSGISGNFGQANYAAAKMGLIGLANTLSIEGTKYNIHCNVIVPTAASRLTQNILPEELFRELKPKLIAPIVAYMCHETCDDNGVYIESAAGWAAKMNMVRGKGAILRTSLQQDNISLEDVRDKWSQITNMDGAKYQNNLEYLFDVLNTLQNETVDATIDEFEYSHKDLILYALGIGASVANSDDLVFLYENHPQFCAIPTYFVMPGLMVTMTRDLVLSALPNKDASLAQILHGEQYLEICSEIPISGKLKTSGSVLDIMDKGSGAVVVTNCNSYDANGQLVIKNQSAIFVVGAGNYGGKSEPNGDVIPIIPSPNYSPDATKIYQTSADQAALYRLSGDLNPLHIDPNFSMLAGHKIPILHGLCSMGYSVRAVLATYANNNCNLFKAVKVRFTSPVIPGQTLKIDMWKKGKRIHFSTSIVETGKNVITGAYVDLKDFPAKL